MGIKNISWLKETGDKLKEVEKTVYSLNSESCELKVGVERLESMCKPLRKHIFNAHRQWNAHNQLRLDFNDETIISIEDYQMNLEKVHQANPTSLAYASNKFTVAMYPICIEYKAPDGTRDL